MDNEKTSYNSVQNKNRSKNIMSRITFKSIKETVTFANNNI